jgi:peptidyl-prolyl cis-trans isomerase SurA
MANSERRLANSERRLAITAACAAAALLAVLSGPRGSAQEPVVIERTLAIVDNQVITLSDVRTMSALGLVETLGADDAVAAGTERLIERMLMLREVQRYAPSEPSEAEIDAALARLRGRYETALAFARVLEAGGFTTARLRAWVRDDLLITSYLDQRFAVAGVPTEQDIGAYYAAHREEFERSGVPFEEVVPLIRSRLAGERRRDLIADWVEGLRRRTEVVELYRRQ